MTTKRKWAYRILMALGAAMWAAAIIIPSTSRIISALSGFGITLFIIGAARMIQDYRISHNPEYARRYDIEMHDERLLYLRGKAMTWAFWISIEVEVIIGMCLTYFSASQVIRNVGTGLCIVVCAQILLYVVVFKILEKRY